MEENHRQLLARNFEYLVNNCKSDILLALLRHRVALSNEEYAELERMSDQKKQSRALFQLLPSLGAGTFNALLAALRESNQFNILRRLDPANSVAINPTVQARQPPLVSNKVFRPPIYTDLDNARYEEYVIMADQTERLEVLVKLSSELKLPQPNSSIRIYNTTSRNRGLVKVINAMNVRNRKQRIGSEIDVVNVKSLFTQMGLTVDVLNTNPTRDQMWSAVRRFVVDERLRTADIAILFIMSHGGRTESQADFVYGSDGGILLTKDIERQFTNDHCEYMQGKPKIILYQSCRGDFPDQGVVARVETDSLPNEHVFMNRILPMHGDLLIAHSTSPDTASHRDTLIGTWFVYLICKVFMKYAHKLDVEEMLKIVNEKLRRERAAEKETMQTGEFTSRTFAKCYFNPGIYLHEDTTTRMFNCGD